MQLAVHTKLFVLLFVVLQMGLHLGKCRCEYRNAKPSWLLRCSQKLFALNARHSLYLLPRGRQTAFFIFHVNQPELKWIAS